MSPVKGNLKSKSTKQNHHYQRSSTVHSQCSGVDSSTGVAVDHGDPQLSGAASRRVVQAISCPVDLHGLDPNHPLTSEILEICQRHWDSWGASTSGMELLDSEASMKVFRRRLDQDGTDEPILAVQTVTGVTAKEVAQIFWHPEYRLEWEHTVESQPVLLETLSSNTLLLHQIHKRMWPAAQRDSVFWTHFRQDLNRTMVVNFSTEIGAPAVLSGRQRMHLNVSLLCETEPLAGDQQVHQAMDRDRLRCRMQYSAIISPGGWVPKAVVRQVCKSEFPRFLRKFTVFCVEKLKRSPIQL